MNKEIGIIGDFHQSKTQLAISESIEHSNRELGVSTKYRWIETMALDGDQWMEELTHLDGIWSASGSPFMSLKGSLRAIRYAREYYIPHLGTCGGYQHSIIEYARNVLGFTNANHAEYHEEVGNFFVDRMTCSLAGTRGKISLEPNTAAREIVAADEIEVDYYCSYGLSDDYKDLVLCGDFIASGFDVHHAVRMIELRSHPFFIITAFVPQVDSTFEHPNKLVTAFIKEINKR